RDASQFITFNGMPNDTLPDTPSLMVSYGIKLADPKHKFAARINAAYYGDTLTQDWSVVDFVTVFSAPYIHRPTGTVVKMTFDKEIANLASAHSQLGLRVEISNLLDGANEMFWGYPGAGRSYYVGLRYDY